MDSRDAEFLKHLLATFRVEAQEQVSAISVGLIELEKTPEPKRAAELIETVFRQTHSLKGSARSVDQRDIESVCQPLESIFAAIKNQQIAISPTLCDLSHQAVDYIARLVASPESKTTPADRAHQQELIRRLKDVFWEGAPSDQPPASVTAAHAPPPQPPPQQATPTPEEGMPALGESVRLPTAKLDPLLRQAEEMLLLKQAAGSAGGRPGGSSARRWLHGGGSQTQGQIGDPDRARRWRARRD